MADVSSDSGGSGDIVEGEPGDERVELHKEGKGLADPTGGAEDRDLALGDGAGVERSPEEVAGFAPLDGGFHRSEQRSSHLSLERRGRGETRSRCDEKE